MITFDEPIPFDAALDQLAEKDLLPTSLSSAKIRETMSADLKARSLFSARTTKAGILQGYKDKLKDLLDGKMNIATARAQIQDMYDGLKYTPQGGFTGDEDLDIPPAERGSLRDLSSNKRIDLVLQTNMRQMANFAFKEKGQTDQALFNYPCWELVRVYPKKVPRGEKLEKGELVEDADSQDWPARWEQCAGEFYDGRMIATKDSDIWAALGDSSTFDDALDTDIPPFAFNSGYGWREVPRQECIDLGVIEEDTDIQGSQSQMNQGLEASARFDPEFLKALRSGLDVQIKDGVAKLKGAK